MSNNSNNEDKNIEEYDYIVVGAGNVGCVIANRLSEDPNVTVCVLESGRDDARIPISKQKLPLPSDAPIPQPGDYDWQRYIRGGIFLTGPLFSRSFVDSWFFERFSEDPKSRSINYNRASTWGGATSHNYDISTRQSPFNWDQWVEKGLTEWSAEKMIPFYKKAQNRSQIAAPEFGGQPYYSPNIPKGKMGNFNPKTDNINGMVPTIWFSWLPTADPNFTNALYTAVNSISQSEGFNFPDPFTYGLVDIATQDRKKFMKGGLGAFDLSLTDQRGQIIPPGKKNLVPFAVYNRPLYGDDGFVYPPELAPFGRVGLANYQRVSAANTYLYAAQNRANLTIKSKILVTKLLLETQTKNPSNGNKVKAVGVKYLKGWNIYQTGRNPNPEKGGYGGSPGDARANAILSKLKGYKTIRARKEIILSAGVFNSPQILLLSGIGPKDHLQSMGIKVMKDLPGVGQNLLDNTEYFMEWQTGKNTPSPIAFYGLSTKSLPSLPYPDFDVFFGVVGTQVLETVDFTIQNNWFALKGPGALANTFVRNRPENLLLDPNAVSNGPNGPAFSYSNGRVTQTGNTITLLGGAFNSSFVNGTIVFANGQTSTITAVNGNNSITVNTSRTFTTPTTYTIYYGNGYIPTYFDPAHYCGALLEKEVDNSTRGFLELKSLDPTVPPRIVFSKGNEAKDVEDMFNVMYHTVLPAMLALHNPTDDTKDYFAGLIDPQPWDILKPGINHFTSMNDVDQTRLRDYLANHTGGHHAGGTCGMGVKSDPLAVVDQHARVYGVDGLRVADASILPASMRWPNFNLYPVGEHIADFIKNDTNVVEKINKCEHCCTCEEVEQEDDTNNTCNNSDDEEYSD